MHDLYSKSALSVNQKASRQPKWICIDSMGQIKTPSLKDNVWTLEGRRAYYDRGTFWWESQIHRHTLARRMFILTKVYEEDFAWAVLQLVSVGGITRDPHLVTQQCPPARPANRKG